MKIRYKILIGLSVFILLLSLAINYINRTFIPVKLKSFITKTITEQTGQETEIEALKFSITRGFVVNRVKIYEGPKQDERFLFKADKVSFGIILLPSFKRRNLIIPRITIEGPYLKVERSNEGIWNIPPALVSKKEDKGRSQPFKLVIKGISFNKGILYFKDYYRGRSLQKTATNLRGNAGLSLPNSISLNCIGKVENALLRVTAKYKLPKRELSIELGAKDLILAEYCNTYLGTDRQKIDSGVCDLSIRAVLSNFKKVKAKGNLSITGLKAEIKDITYAGDYRLRGRCDLSIKEIADLNYDIILGVEKATVTTPSPFPLPNGEMARVRGKDIEGTLSLSQERWSTKELALSLYGSPAVISGNVFAPHKDFLVDINLSSTLALTPIAEALGLGIEKGRARINTDIKFKKDRSYQLKGETFIEDLILRQKGVLISGNFSISGESSGTAGDWEAITYNGKMSFEQASIEGADFLPFISDVSGNAVFGARYLSIKKLIGTAADAKIALSGRIDYSQKEPVIGIKLKADDLSLSKLLYTLPEGMKTKLKNIEADGSCTLGLAFNGTAGKPETYSYEGNLTLRNSSVGLPYWPHNLSNIDCEIQFKKQEILWEKMYFNIRDTRYHSYGKLEDLEAPKISLAIKSEDTDVVLEMKIEDKTISILKCDGRYRNSLFSITGDVSDIKTLYAKLSGNVELDLKDTPYIFEGSGSFWRLATPHPEDPDPERSEGEGDEGSDRSFAIAQDDPSLMGKNTPRGHIFSARKATLRRLKPEGVIKLTFSMQGPIREVGDWTLFVEGGADKISVWGLLMHDFYLDYRMKDRFVDIPVVSAYPYGGIVQISSRANLKADEKPYIINIDIKDIDLHQLLKDTKLRDKRIKGNFVAQAVLNGYLNKKGSLKGNGWLQVSDGYLWEFPVMRGMMELIFMIPPEYVTLTDAFGNFSLHDNRIYTEDFKILSKTASLLWVGSLGLDGTLDFNVTGRFAEEIIKQASQPGKIASALLREAGSLIMEIRLTGTIAKPSYQVVPFPVQRILKEKVFDRFKDIFGNILE